MRFEAGRQQVKAHRSHFLLIIPDAENPDGGTTAGLPLHGGNRKSTPSESYRQTFLSHRGRRAALVECRTAKSCETAAGIVEVSQEMPKESSPKESSPKESSQPGFQIHPVDWEQPSQNSIRCGGSISLSGLADRLVSRHERVRPAIPETGFWPTAGFPALTPGSIAIDTPTRF